jgi:hypothetical protein
MRRRFSRRISRARVWWHERRGHHIVRTISRDVRFKGVRGYEFYFDYAFRCLECKVEWF